MEDPSPIIHNLLFEDSAADHPARITFTYMDGATPHEIVLTPDMVRDGQVRVHGLDDDVATFVVTCQTTELFLDEENQALFRQWCHRQNIPVGSQLMSK